MVRYLLPLCAGLILSPAASPQLSCDDEACCGTEAPVSVVAVPTAPAAPAVPAIAARPATPARPAIPAIAATPATPAAPACPSTPAIAATPACPATPAVAPMPASLAYAPRAPRALTPVYSTATVAPLCDPDCQAHEHKSKSKSKSNSKSTHSFFSDGDDGRHTVKIITRDGDPQVFEVDSDEDFEWESEDGSVFVIRKRRDGADEDVKVFVGGDGQSIDLPDLKRFGLHFGDDDGEHRIRIVRPHGDHDGDHDDDHDVHVFGGGQLQLHGDGKVFSLGDGHGKGKPFFIKKDDKKAKHLSTEHFKDKIHELKTKLKGKSGKVVVTPDSDIGRWALELAEQAQEQGTHWAEWADEHGEEVHEHAQKWARWAEENAHDLAGKAQRFAIELPDMADMPDMSTIQDQVQRALREVERAREDQVRVHRDAEARALDAEARARDAYTRATEVRSHSRDDRDDRDDADDLMRNLHDVIQDIRNEVKNLRREVGELRERVGDER